MKTTNLSVVSYRNAVEYIRGLQFPSQSSNPEDSIHHQSTAHASLEHTRQFSTLSSLQCPIAGYVHQDIGHVEDCQCLREGLSRMLPKLCIPRSERLTMLNCFPTSVRSSTRPSILTLPMLLLSINARSHSPNSQERDVCRICAS